MKAGRRNQQGQGAGSQTPRRRRRFTQEFKLEAVRLATGGDRSIPEVAHDLGIGANSLPDSAFGPALSALLLDDTAEGGKGPIDFRSLGVREFGTIYEGLLESELSVAETDLAVDPRWQRRAAYRLLLATTPSHAVSPARALISYSRAFTISRPLAWQPRAISSATERRP